MGSCDQVSLKEAMESFKVSVCVLAVVGLCQSAPQVNTNQVVQTVTTQLQPLISDAVARALASISISSSSSSSGFARGTSSGSFGATSGAAVARGLSEEEELEYNRKLNANAAYDYGYKVANDEKQTYMAHEETRKGADVQGKYNYVDANGDLVTVTYTAGVDGYNEERSVTPGAVTYRAENIAGPWEGPLAGQTEVEVVPAPRAQAPRPAPRPAAPAIDQSALIRTILSQLQPQISSAVQTAISSSSRTVSAPVRTVSSSSSSTPQLFAGDNSVRISTPEFNIEY